jgi:hypothetical protein
MKRGKIRKQIILPKRGGLAPFTEMFETWYNKIPYKENILFPTATPDGTPQWNKPLSRDRAQKIILKTTGLFPHWFRGAHETLYGNQILKGDIYALVEHMGVRRVDSVLPYVTSQIEKYTPNLYNL